MSNELDSVFDFVDEKMNEEVFGDDRSYHDDRFKINNDDEADRLLCDYQKNASIINENKKKAEAAKKRYTELIDNWYEVSTNNIEKDNELIMMLLNDYIERARKDGRKSFNFVHGSIKYRKPADKIKYVDEMKIIEWLKANSMDEFLKTSYSIDKVPFKKSCEVNDKYFYYKGKQVPGMHMEECPAEIIMPDKTRYSKEPEFSTFENSQWGQLPFDSDIPF